MSRLVRRTALSGLLMLLASYLAFGQGITTGSITGTVQDPQQKVISGAQVTAVQNGTNSAFNGITNSVGAFEVRGVPVGTYTVTINASGFNKITLDGIVVNASSPTSVGLQQLAVGGGETSVTVEASAPLLQTDSIQAGQTFDTQKVSDLPIGNGVDFVALLTPGVVPSGDAGFSNNNGAEFAANGQRGRSNNFQLDGQSNNDTSVAGPEIFFGNTDAIAEVQVLTQYSAEYGRDTGSVVNYITKAGTNSFHGTGYEVYDGDFLDSLANQDKSPLFGICPKGVAAGTVTAFASNGCTTAVVPRYVENRYGGTMGGPIVKDKLWFFGSGNFDFIRTGATLASSGGQVTPTPTGLQQLQAAFPGNPAVGALAAIGPFSVNKGTIDINSVSTVPVGGVPIQVATITRKLPSIANDYEATGRVDWQISQNDRFFGRYIFQHQLFTNVSPGGTVPLAAGDFFDEPSRDQQVGLDYTHTFSPTLLNQARFSYSRVNVAFEAGAYPNCTRASFEQCPTRIQFLDGSTLTAGLNPGFPQGRFVIDYQAQDNASKQIGTHSLKFGGEFARQRQPNFFLPELNGLFVFNSFADTPGGPASDFIANTPVQATIANGPPNPVFTENDGAFYFQDDWKVRDNFTLTLGLRYELASQAVNSLHDLTVARESNPATAFWDPNVPLSLRTVPSIPMDKNNLGPVVGFSWSPRLAPFLFGQDKTVIRGGFRIAYDPEFYNIFSNVANTAPTVNLATVTSCPGCLVGSGIGGDVRNATLPLVPNGVDPGRRTQDIVTPNFHNPYSQEWNLGVQREIGSHLVAEARYVGNHTVGLFQSFNANPALGTLIANGFSNVIPSGLTPCSTPGAPGFAAGYADCNHTRVLERGNTAFSIYHSLQTRLDVQNLHGITAGASYTFSHTIDNVSEIFSSLGGGNTLSFSQSPFDIDQAERANSGLDYPNVASIYMIYELPFFKNRDGFLGRALGGWQINPVWRYVSGQPYTVIQNRQPGGAAGNLCDPTGAVSTTRSACRPILNNPGAPIDTVGQFVAPGQVVNFFTGAPVAANAVHWIVNDTTAAQILGTPFAGVGRNTERGDTINNVNLAVIKNLKMTERLSLQLRATAFNILNRDYRGNPDPIIDDGSFRDVQGSFANTFFNNTGGFQTNSVFSGIDRRRIELEGKIIF